MVHARHPNDDESGPPVDDALGDPIANYYKEAEPCGVSDPSSLTKRLSDRVEFFIRGADTIHLESDLGSIGRRGDSSYNTVADGYPIIPLTAGQPITPLGYYVV